MVLGAGEGLWGSTPHHRSRLLTNLSSLIFSQLFGPLRCYLAACLLEQLQHGLLTLHALPPLCLDLKLGLVDHGLEQLEYVFFRLDSFSSLLGNSCGDMDRVLVQLGVDLLPSGYSLDVNAFSSYSVGTSVLNVSL